MLGFGLQAVNKDLKVSPMCVFPVEMRVFVKAPKTVEVPGVAFNSVR